MKSAIAKRTLVVNGRKTSVSLENEFWSALAEIAVQQLTRVQFAAEIAKEHFEGNLSSALRLHILEHYWAGGGVHPECPTLPTSIEWDVERF